MEGKTSRIMYWRLCCDAFAPYAGRPHSFMAVYLQCLNFPYALLGRLETVRLICLGPHGANVAQLLAPILDELRALAADGIAMRRANPISSADTELTSDHKRDTGVVQHFHHIIACMPTDLPQGSKFTGHGGMGANRVCRCCYVSKHSARQPLAAADASAEESKRKKKDADAKAERSAKKTATEPAAATKRKSKKVNDIPPEIPTDSLFENLPTTDSKWSRSFEQLRLLLKRLPDFTVEARAQELRTRYGLDRHASADRSGFPGAFEGVIDPFQQLPIDPDHLCYGIGQTVCAG
jgi:hypothetical protein